MKTKNRRFGKALVLAALACLARPRDAHAWGRVGHEAVAQIAQDILKREDKPLYDRILKIVGLDEDGIPVGMANIAACPDGMKGRFFRGGGIVPGPLTTAWCAHTFRVPVMPESGAWHYIDIPLTAEPTAKTLNDYCIDDKGHRGGCLTDTLRRYMADLRGAKSDADRRFALMMFVHLYGDLHQPMHCIDEGDRGGNSKHAHIDGGRINLHAVWDNMIELQTTEKVASYEKRERAGSKIEKFSDYTKLLENDMKKKDASGWLQGDLIDGPALESFYIAKRKIYPAYFESLGPDGQEPSLDQNDIAYYETMKPIVEDQIEKAGVRLAFLLEQAFGPQAAPAAIGPLTLPAENAADSTLAAPARPLTLAGSAPSSAAPTLMPAAPANAEGSDFEQALHQEGARILARAAADQAAGKQGKWTPSKKYSAYRGSVEFDAVLKVLGLDVKSVDRAVADGVDMKSVADKAIYAKAWSKVQEKALKAEQDNADWAVVLDVDETVLDNSAYFKRIENQYGGKNSAEEWSAWVQGGAERQPKAPAIPGAREFLTSLHQLVQKSGGHGHVVFIPQRTYDQTEATLASLRAQDLYRDGDILLATTGEEDTKFARRACIENGRLGTDPRCLKYEPMRIVALFGSDIRDSVQACTRNEAELFRDTLQWGERDWPLWNEQYGPWENDYSCGH